MSRAVSRARRPSRGGAARRSRTEELPHEAVGFVVAVGGGRGEAAGVQRGERDESARFRLQRRLVEPVGRVAHGRELLLEAAEALKVKRRHSSTSRAQPSHTHAMAPMAEQQKTSESFKKRRPSAVDPDVDLTQALVVAALANDGAAAAAICAQGGDPCARLADGSTPLLEAANALASGAARALLLAALEQRAERIMQAARAALDIALATGSFRDIPAMPPHPLEARDALGRSALHRVYARRAPAEGADGVEAGAQAAAARKATLSALLPDDAAARAAPGARAALDGRDGRGRTVAMLAAAAGDGEALFLALSLGADGAATDADGWSAAHHAAAGGHAAALAALAATGAPLDLGAADGASPLLVACGRGRRAAVVELLACLPLGDAMAADERGRTPLAAAAAGGHLGVVSELLLVGGLTQVWMAGVGGGGGGPV